ncbi:hypothetical protein EDC94DRAFT_438472 [Helicostylum pulchrum]|uniref:S1-like domain-containing protein n=1 Tax=Helicostylum pulchrum TaxID=562976 RepID=A0ABP9Y374_9FUNG|nr:hypothetical protein EDC94DRAFT_438472 [Helicostylum pulchrum]
MGKKQTARNQLDDDFEIEGNQTYARSLGPRGNHQHEVEFTDGSKKLVTLPPKFRNVVWLKRGHYVIVDPSVGVTEKVGGEIVFVLFPKNIKDLKAAGKWPAEFSEPAPAVTTQEEEEKSDDDLFVNNNRPIMSETESESSDEE